MEGFFKIRMHKDNLGIESDCSFARPSDPIPVTAPPAAAANKATAIPIARKLAPAAAKPAAVPTTDSAAGQLQAVGRGAGALVQRRDSRVHARVACGEHDASEAERVALRREAAAPWDLAEKRDGEADEGGGGDTDDRAHDGGRRAHRRRAVRLVGKEQREASDAGERANAKGA